MFIEPPEYTSAAEMREAYKQVRKRIYAVPAPKIPPKLEKPARVWPSAPERDWRFIDPPQVKAITIDEIIEVVCTAFRVCESDLKSARRFKTICYPRMIAFYFSREKTGATFPTIARIFGKRDHTTVLSGCKKIERLLKSGDKLTVRVVAHIERALAR